MSRRGTVNATGKTQGFGLPYLNFNILPVPSGGRGRGRGLFPLLPSPPLAPPHLLRRLTLPSLLGSAVLCRW